jgi:hypothetical protein
LGILITNIKANCLVRACRSNQSFCLAAIQTVLDFEVIDERKSYFKSPKIIPKSGDFVTITLHATEGSVNTISAVDELIVQSIEEEGLAICEGLIGCAIVANSSIRAITNDYQTRL